MGQKDELETKLQIAEKDARKLDAIAALLAEQLRQLDPENRVLKEYMVMMGDAHKCAGCGEIISIPASIITLPDGHKIYLCVECTHDSDNEDD